MDDSEQSLSGGVQCSGISFTAFTGTEASCGWPGGGDKCALYSAGASGPALSLVFHRHLPFEHCFLGWVRESPENPPVPSEKEAWRCNRVTKEMSFCTFDVHGRANKPSVLLFKK